MLRPGVWRAVFGLIIGLILGIALITLIRVLVFNYPFASGPAVLFGGFGGLFGWLWGVGSFNPYSHEHNGMEHLAEHPETTAIEHALEAARKATPEIAQSTRPLIQPLLLALGICVVVVIVFMVIGMAPTPLQRVSTDTATASAVTPTGSLNLFGLIINKTVFFAILAVVVLVILGVLSLIFALLMGALGNQVDKAKKSPDNPPQEEPPLFRLIDFFVSWVHDILEGTRQSVNR